MFESIYDDLVKIAISQQRKIDLKADMSKLYHRTLLPFHNREIEIAYTKVPTFRIDGKYRYYAPILVRIEEYYKNEIKKIYEQCKEVLDSQDIDSYTIFLFGKNHDWIDPIIDFPRRYNIVRFNTAYPSITHRNRTYRIISNFLRKRAKSIMSKKVVYGDVLNDCKRIIDVAEKLDLLTNTSIRKVIRNSNTNSNTIVLERGGN